MRIEFQQIEERIKQLQDSLAQQKKLADDLGNKEVKDGAVQEQMDFYTQPSRRGGIGGRRSMMMPPIFLIPDQNMNPAP